MRPAPGRALIGRGRQPSVFESAAGGRRSGLGGASRSFGFVWPPAGRRRRRRGPGLGAPSPPLPPVPRPGSRLRDSRATPALDRTSSLPGFSGGSRVPCPHGTPSPLSPARRLLRPPLQGHLPAGAPSSPHVLLVSGHSPGVELADFFPASRRLVGSCLLVPPCSFVALWEVHVSGSFAVWSAGLPSHHPLTSSSLKYHR